MKKLPAKIPAATKGAAGAASLIGPVSSIVGDFIRWRLIAAQETTKQAEIAARRDILLRDLEINRELMVSYMERAFAERAESLRLLYGLLDRAVAEKDHAALDTAVTGIVGIIKESPLRDFTAFRSMRTRGEIIDI